MDHFTPHCHMQSHSWMYHKFLYSTPIKIIGLTGLTLRSEIPTLSIVVE